MILLFLGLAFVLTTSSSLLVASGSWREDDGADDCDPPHGSPSGEISGSISITAKGEVWLTVLIDDMSILANLEIIENGPCKKGYRLSIAAIDTPIGTWGSTTSHLLPLTTQKTRMVEFCNSDEASNGVLQLLDSIGIVVSEESLRSIPYAITCGWKSPEECERVVGELLQGNPD